MLNDIRLHLDSDEHQQSQNEQVFAQNITHTEKANIAAFNTFIPSVGKAIDSLPSKAISLFIDKDKQTNIVNIHSGATFYNLGADQIIETQAQAWPLNSALLCINDKTSLSTQTASPVSLLGNSFEHLQQYANDLSGAIATESIDTLVIFGLGKGAHLPLLSNDLKPTRIVIYEHNLEIFRVSLSLFDWAGFLENAHAHNVQIFLQLGSQQSSIYDDICELCQHTDASRILFYQHEKTTVSNQVMRKVRQGSWGPTVSDTETKPQHHNNQPLSYLSSISLGSWNKVHGDEKLFVSNLALFEQYFPDIYAAYKDYKPTNWDLIYHAENNEINLFNKTHCTFMSNDLPRKEGELMAQNFIQHPNLDGLAFGYSGSKLKHYMHNRLMCQADASLKKVTKQHGELPNTVKALLVFGLGQGYMLQSVCEAKDIQNIIICEPNPDFFYASLYAIDWAPIFEKVSERQHKLYINIGEASSVLYKDLMSQFLTLGPHLLNETYMMQAYDNPALRQVLSEVRTQLQVIFAMGENFDHVLYGLSHTFQSMHQGVSSLRYEPAQYLSYQQKQLPVFIVGNGPSLDTCIDTLKECRDQVIVVSCGTALQALHKHGIVPDFHGEVEQNRANFDWVSRINDYAYLKQITLLSVNGMHPHTIALFKNVLLAFKHGESSTNAALAMLPANSYHCLKYAYPTVSNMVVSLFLSMGFEQLYFVGIDLGFAEQEKHHSAASGYYENGKQIYNYKGTHHTELRAKGNKQAWVFTKTEFNISRMIVEEALAAHKSECFNLSNGVFIAGTIPLHEENILVMSNNAQKHATLSAMNNCFMALTSNVPELFSQSYRYDLLIQQVHSLIELSSQPFVHKADIDTLIETLRSLLFKSQSDGGSSFFYYYFSTVNYACAALSKAIMQDDECAGLETANTIRQFWLQCLNDNLLVLAKQYELVDSSDTFGDRREQLLLEHTAPLTFCITHKQQFEYLSGIAEQQSITNCKLISSMEDTSNCTVLFGVWDKHCVQAVKQMLLAQKTLQKEKLAIVVHEYDLMPSLRAESVFEQISLIYMPPLAESDNLSVAQQQGSSPYYLVQEYFHTLQARAQDIALYKEILCKPRFCKTGLINANSLENDVNQAQSDEISSRSVNSEFDSVAVKSIATHISPYLNMTYHYMFKRYAGLPRTELKTINVVDALHNCGLLVERSPFSFELLGVWQPQ